MENKTNTHINSKLIRSIYTSGYASQIIRIALLIDIFGSFNERALNSKEIADYCKCSINGVKYLVDCLCSLGLLNKNKEGYSITPTSSVLLKKDKQSYVGDLILQTTAPYMFENILFSVKTGIPSLPNIYWEQLAWLESFDTRRIDSSFDMWTKAGIKPQSKKSMKILDLACGCGIMTFVLATENPLIEITCVDDTKVLTVAKDLSHRMGISGQINFLPANLHDIRLSEKYYDVIHLGNVTNFFSESENINLLNKLHGVLKNNGALIINVTMNSGVLDENTSIASFILWSLWGSDYYDYSTYEYWLKSLGFSKITKLSENVILSKKT
jgi:ubiquinone/menaquinone biosynthesis C-methylase UbiE